MKFTDPYYQIDPTKPHDPVAESGRDATGRFTAKLSTNTLTDDNFPINSRWWSRPAKGVWGKIISLRGIDFAFRVLPDEFIDSFSWRMICEMFEEARDALQAGKSDDEAVAAAHDYLKRKQIETAAKMPDGTEPSPIISGGEVLETSVSASTLDDENLPF